MSEIKMQIIKLVSSIPEGKIAYFGQIGAECGVSGQVVGWILSGMPESEWSSCPWYRVVSKNGFISSLKLGTKGLIQKQVLLDEGYTLIGDSIDMQKHEIADFRVLLG